MRISNDRYGRVRVHIDLTGNWEEFDDLVTALQANPRADSNDVVDGPESRLCRFTFDGVQLCLVHDDDLGNFVLATEISARTKAEQYVQMVEFGAGD